MPAIQRTTSADQLHDDSYPELHDSDSSTAESPSLISTHTSESATVLSDEEAHQQQKGSSIMDMVAAADHSSETGEDTSQHGSVDDAAQATAASTLATVEGGYEGGATGGDETNEAKAKLEEFKAKEEDSKHAMEDLGTVKMLGSGFFDKAGEVIDTLVPNEGDIGKLKLTVNVPADPAGIVKVGLAFEAQVSRVGGQTKMKAQAAANVSAKQKIDAYFFAVEAFARANLAGYIESSGDDGAEAFHLVGLAIYEQIHGVSATVADAVFSTSFIEHTIEEMDEDDYVDVALSGSFAAGVGGEVADDLSAKAEAATAAKVKKHLSKGDDGKLSTETTTSVDNSVSVSVTAKAAPFTATGKLSAKWKGTTFDKLSASLTGDATLDVSEMSDLVQKGEWIGQMCTSLYKMIKTADTGSSSSKAGQMAKLTLQASNMEAGLEGMTASALEDWDYFKGMKLKYRLTVTSNYSESKGFDLSVKLDRVSSLSLGSSEDDAMISILLENTQNLFHWKA